MGKNNSKIRFMTQLALLIAVQIVMKLVGLGMVPVGPLKMSFLTVPIAVGAIVLGPVAGAVLGAVFGLVSFYDALTGASAMTGTFLSIAPIHTFILCVVTRTLMGWLTGVIFKGLNQVIKNTSKYFVGAICAPLLNTFFFMGYICLVFYNTDYVQALVAALGATNPIAFVVLLVGVQGLVEAVACSIIGGAVAKGVDVIVKKGK